MFNYSNMLKRALEYFPLWSDIRKRSDKSIGGQLVDTALKETLELDSAIKKYKDFYFLDKYKGKEDTIIAFVYGSNIGQIKDTDYISYVEYNNKKYELTNDIDEFYNNINIVYYENGNVYLRLEIIDPEVLSFSININDYNYEYQLEKKHVWNIFDEYAVFVGIERHIEETNKQLLDRIIYTTKNLGNSSEKGLKNAIISELMSLVDITERDIVISKVTPENLVKPYKEYKTLLEMLDKINRDCLKDKQWDLDKWSYSFKSIEFLDNVWDEIISEYQNGIGSDTDLKVIMADQETTTDADIIMYNKSLVKLEKYVQDKNIKKEISFQLKKYEDILTPINAKYNIKASEAIEITNDNIELSVFEYSQKEEKRKIEEIYKLGKDVVAVDNSKITDNQLYRLEFYPDNYNSMSISKAKVIYKHKVTNEIVEVKDLLKPAPGFTLNAQGSLVNTSIKKSVKSIKHFNSYEGLIDNKEGIELGYGINTGRGVLNVSGLGLSNVIVDIEHQLVDMPYSLIKNDKYSFWKENELVFRYDINQERKFVIDTEANEISFELIEGDADLFIEIDGNTSYEKLSEPKKWTSKTYDNSKRIKLTVISNHDGPVRFSNFKYACHNIDLKLQYGNLIKDNHGYRLPNIAINNLIIEMSSKTSSSPILKAIYVGGDMQSLKYLTDIIPNKDNCNRIIEISTNGLVDLLTVNTVGSILNRNKKYTPATSYKALKDNAWIRLNLEEYENIKNVVCDNASTYLIEESGKVYYNITMKAGQSVNFVTIDGIRNTALKTITLENMIKRYFPEYDSSRDKVYANKLCKGLIIENNNPDNPKVLIIKIKNNIFEGIDAKKYKFTKLPDSLTISFNSIDSQINNIETEHPFDSISFIPAGTKIYQAINETNMFTGEVRNIKVLNNFSPILSTKTLMYYEVIPFEATYDFDVKFCSVAEKNHSFDILNNWCLGLKDLAIKTPIDLSNSKSYKITTIDMKDEVLLSRYVDLKRSYKLSENNEIFTNKYIVIPEPGCEVIYERYSDKQNENLIIQEELLMEEDGFTKLAYSNIDELLYIGYSAYDGRNEITISEFELLKDEGIMLWTDKSLIDQAKKVYLRYTIKNPISILLSEDALYKAIGYDIDAYEEIDRFSIAGITDGYRFDLRQLDRFNEVDMIYTKCSSPSFNSEGVNNVLIFNKVVEKDTLLVQTGYYYINGREYYLFPSQDEVYIKNEKHIQMDNVDISGEEITTFKATNNFVRNSEMIFRGINELYNFDASKSNVHGVSFMESLTACDSFNSWNTFGTKMFLKNGLNGLGINFSPEIPNGYAYVDITHVLKQNEMNYISLWSEKSLSIYIGEEKKYLNMDFPHSIDIKILNEISHETDNIRSSVIVPKENKKYYLIVKGSGTIDDIIISNDSNLIAAHKKNIDLLNLKITEHCKSGQKIRVNFDDNDKVINKGALLTKDKYIKIASNMYWGVSPLYLYDTREDFNKCSSLNVNIENNYIYTDKTEGHIETPPICLDNPKTIKRLIFKINEIGFENMRGIKIQILSCNSRNGEYIPVNSFNDIGYVYGDSLLKYIKLRIVMPEKKYINNFGIYAEYCSTKDNYPKLLTPSSGELITKIIDTQYSNNYKIRDIDISDISSLGDVDLFVQCSKDSYSADIWHSWKKIELTQDLRISKQLVFNDTRFFRFKVLLKTSNSAIKINNIDIEVI